ncbi:transaldolase [Enterococcus camelliae]|uniref:Transaldolase n=1 Tax=Enterococcus camelliae TaxID=453959 RepID=A0ABW5TIK2_9ENTE
MINSRNWFSNISIFSDGADLKKMKQSYETGLVNGFTTNPSLMKKAGVTDYLKFAKEAVDIFPNLSISFEVFGDDVNDIKREAHILTNLGRNVFVKIPIISIHGTSNAKIIEELSSEEIKLNITAVTTISQVEEAVDSFGLNTENYVSIFVGRLNDVGIETGEFVKQSKKICEKKKNTKLLWASTRELYNIKQAKELGCDIITVPPELIDKLNTNEKSAISVSLDTVRGFQKDIESLGFSIEE